MKRTLVFGLVAALAAAAAPVHAQPDEDEEDDEDFDEDDGVELDRDPPPDEPEPEPEPERPRRPPPPVVEAAPVERRPDGMSLAIGGGWAIPSDDLLAPDVTSVRLRLGSGLTFEPLLTLSRGSSTQDDGTTALTTTTTELGVSVLVRYPYRVNERVDLSLCGGAGLAQTSVDREEMMPDTSSTELGLSWGLALDYWVKRHWVVSLTAMNPFAGLAKTTTDSAGIEQSTSSNFIGIIFDPQTYLTVHLYY